MAFAGEQLPANQPLVTTVGKGPFPGNTSQAIGMYFNLAKPGECVRVLDPIYAKDPKFNEGINNIIPISNLSTISMGDGSRQLTLPFSGRNRPIRGAIILRRQTWRAR